MKRRWWLEHISEMPPAAVAAGDAMCPGSGRAPRFGSAAYGVPLARLELATASFLRCALGAALLVGCGAGGRLGQTQAGGVGGPACNAEPPEGAPAPAPLPVYDGVCPSLSPAPAPNVIPPP